MVTASMGCRYYSEGEREAELLQELDEITRLLCGVLTWADAAPGELRMRSAMLEGNEELRAWWEEHKRRDAARKFEEERRAEMERQRAENAKHEKRDLELVQVAHVKLGRGELPNLEEREALRRRSMGYRTH